MQFTQHRSSARARWIVVLACSGIFLTGPSTIMAKNKDIQLVSFSKDPQQVNLVVGKSTVVNTPVAIKRASLANEARLIATGRSSTFDFPTVNSSF